MPPSHAGVDFGRRWPGDDQHIGAATGHDHAVAHIHDRSYQPVFRARTKLDNEIHLTVNNSDQAREHVGRIPARLVTTRIVGEDQRIRERRYTGCGRELRLQYEGVFDVSPLRRPLRRRLNRPVAGIGVEQSAEHRR